jgi:hypothetical protein
MSFVPASESGTLQPSYHSSQGSAL